MLTVLVEPVAMVSYAILNVTLLLPEYVPLPVTVAVAVPTLVLFL